VADGERRGETTLLGFVEARGVRGAQRVRVSSWARTSSDRRLQLTVPGLNLGDLETYIPHNNSTRRQALILCRYLGMYLPQVGSQPGP
jgi:hypothetical protein